MKEYKQVNILHLIYLIIISVIIVIAVILLPKQCVSDVAFTNFSFASTITSIVLAVVSIIYSLSSSTGTTSHLAEIKDVENRIKEELNRVEGIETHIKNYIEEGNQKLTAQVNTMVEDQVGALMENMKGFYKEIGSERKDLSNISTKTDSKYPFSINSPMGNILLYACAMSFEEKMPLPGSIFKDYSEDAAMYFWGFMVSLSNIRPDDFLYEDGDSAYNSKVIKFNSDYFGTVAEINKSLVDYKSQDLYRDLIAEFNLTVQQHYRM